MLSIFSCAFCISSLWRCLFTSFVHFKIWVNVVLMLSWKSSWYILDTSSLSNMLSADIFSHSMSCVFMFLIVLWSTKAFNLYMVWGMGPNLFFCMWMLSCPSTIYWKDHSSHWIFLELMLFKVSGPWCINLFLNLFHWFAYLSLFHYHTDLIIEVL